MARIGSRFPTIFSDLLKKKHESFFGPFWYVFKVLIIFLKPFAAVCTNICIVILMPSPSVVDKTKFYDKMKSHSDVPAPSGKQG